ncbi:MAG: hypothetical protein JWP95_2128 [Actinotalea sp.]|nr:hypothetical protein [Actinotalea sp.]
MDVLTGLRRTGRGIAWYVRGLVREDAYDRYVAHTLAAHPDDAHRPLMSEREFWRDLSDRQEAEPQGRCC